MATNHDTNTDCPDYMAHYENATERFFGSNPVPDTFTADQDEAITLEADLEYRCCEGH